MATLTDEDRAILDFERHHWRYLGAKDAEVRARFGLSLADYHERLNALLELADAATHAPIVVRRLRRQRQRRIAQRRASRESA
jgi:hypothetical protein